MLKCFCNMAWIICILSAAEHLKCDYWGSYCPFKISLTCEFFSQIVFQLKAENEIANSKIFKVLLCLSYYRDEVMLFIAMLCWNVSSHFIKLLFLLFEPFLCFLSHQKWSHKSGFVLSSHKKQVLFLLTWIVKKKLWFFIYFWVVRE